MREAFEQGVSRRLPHMPKGFVPNQTVVFFAHRHCWADMESGEVLPGVFFACRPHGFEYVVTGEETEEELERYVKRGIQPVRDERVEPAQETLLRT